MFLIHRHDPHENKVDIYYLFEDIHLATNKFRVLYNNYRQFIDYDWYEEINDDLCEKRISQSDFAKLLIQEHINNIYNDSYSEDIIFIEDTFIRFTKFYEGVATDP